MWARIENSHIARVFLCGDSAVRIWDCFLFEGDHFLYQAAVGLLKLFEKELLRADFEECLQVPALAVFLVCVLTRCVCACCAAVKVAAGAVRREETDAIDLFRRFAAVLSRTVSFNQVSQS